jgi:hypothetical protein
MICLGDLSNCKDRQEINNLPQLISNVDLRFIVPQGSSFGLTESFTVASPSIYYPRGHHQNYRVSGGKNRMQVNS